MNLYKSNKPEYRYVMKFNNNLIYFGDVNYVTTILVSDKRRVYYLSNKQDREKIRNEYLECIDTSKLNMFNTREAMESYILYNKPTLSQGIKSYQQRYGVYLKNRHKVEYKNI
jgi:hypothetical protein